MKNTPAPALLEALEPRLAPAGLVIVTTTGGVLSITGGPDGEGNSINISESSETGMWSITSAAGDTFKLNGQDVSGNSFDVLAPTSLKVNLGAGDDRLELSGLKINGAVTLTDTQGEEIFDMQNMFIGGAVKIDTGSGVDRVSFLQSFLNNTLSIKTGAGDDTVLLDLGYYRATTVDLGTGSNTFSLNGQSLLNMYGHLTISAAGDTDAIQDIVLKADDGLITGNVKVTVAKGALNLLVGTAGTDKLTIGGGLAVQSGAGDDTLTITGSLTTGGLLSFKAGEGSNRIEASDDSIVNIGGGLTYVGGKGDDRLQFFSASLSIGGNVSATLGNGSNSFLMLANGSTFVSGSFVYKGGTGDDVLEFDSGSLGLATLVNLTFTGGNGTNSLVFASALGFLNNVTYTGGTGDDTLAIGQASPGGVPYEYTVNGNIKATLGTGSNTFSLQDSQVYGSIATLSTSPAIDSNEVNERWDILNSHVNGKVTQKSTGLAKTALGIHNSSFLALLDLNTGAGNDTFIFDTAGGTDVKNTFKAAVKIQMGDGDDFLQFGSLASLANAGNTFLSTFSLDGGKGFADFAFMGELYGNSYAVEPDIKPTVETAI